MIWRALTIECPEVLGRYRGKWGAPMLPAVTQRSDPPLGHFTAEKPLPVAATAQTPVGWGRASPRTPGSS